MSAFRFPVMLDLDGRPCLVVGGGPVAARKVIGLMDAYWPAHFAMETTPRPMATVSFTLQLLVDPASLDPAEPLFYRASAPAAHEGFVVEFRELWTARRTLVALNQQTFVIIK